MKSPLDRLIFSRHSTLVDARNARNAAACTKQEKSTDQEYAGGACAKRCALRKSGLTRTDVSAAVAEKQISNCAALTIGG